jgi:Family of unknown function (DUF6159)
MATALGKQLFESSRQLFRQDPQMIWLPVLGGVAAAAAGLIVGGAVAGFLFLLGLTGGFYLIAAAVGLFVVTFVSSFFSLGVVFAATDRLEGRTPTIGTCLARSWGRRRVLAPWALFSAAVGILIELIEERAGFFGKLLGFLGGLAWSVATFFVLPVLAFEDLGPLALVKRSSTLLTQRFGAVVRSSVRFGIAYLGWFLLGIALLVVGIVGAVRTPASLLLAAAGVIVLAIVGMLIAVINLYLRTILYRYATGQPIPGIEGDLSQVFASSKRR